MRKNYEEIQNFKKDHTFIEIFNFWENEKK